MSSNIILNRLNIQNEDNNKLTYKFPSNVTFKKDDTIALNHFSIYFSWFNISSKYNNNFFQYKWWYNTATLVTFDILIPNGYYSVTDLFEFIMSVMVKNNHYLKTTSGDNVYFLELITNPVYYSLEFRISSLAEVITLNGVEYNITTSTDVWIAGDWLPPTQFECPQIIIPSNNNFGELIGFSEGRVISQDTSTDIINKQFSFLNTQVPNMEPSSSFIVTCSLVDNDLGVPNNILHSFTVPNNTSFGDLNSPISDITYSCIKPGSYANLEIAIYDQNFDPLIIIDSNMLLKSLFLLHQ